MHQLNAALHGAGGDQRRLVGLPAEEHRIGQACARVRVKHQAQLRVFAGLQRHFTEFVEHAVVELQQVDLAVDGDVYPASVAL